jgi:hypothetical protein
VLEEVTYASCQEFSTSSVASIRSVRLLVSGSRSGERTETGSPGREVDRENVLLFYRSTLTRQEDDQLFIDESSASRASEQSQLIAKVNKINPLVKPVGATYDLGNRGLGRLPGIQLGTTLKPKRP